MLRLSAIQTIQRNAVEYARSYTPTLMLSVSICWKRPDWIPFLSSVVFVVYVVAGGGRWGNGNGNFNGNGDDGGDCQSMIDSGCGGAIRSGTAINQNFPTIDKTAATRTDHALRESDTVNVKDDDVEDEKTAFLHLPTEVLAGICDFLHPKSVTILSTTCRQAQLQFGPGTMKNHRSRSTLVTKQRQRPGDNEAADATDGMIATSNEIWRRIWYRDYGNTLLEWQIGRQVLSQSICDYSYDENSSKTSSFSSSLPTKTRAAITSTPTSLEQRLADHLNRLPHQSPNFSMHDFYFVFGETYVNYLLARQNRLSPKRSNGGGDDDRNDDRSDEGNCRDCHHNKQNSSSSCYLGLHGHIIDFEPFALLHPGLVEIVLKECGQDATVAFENLPHSKGARAIAQRLLVMVHLGTCRPLDKSNETSNDHRDVTDQPWGLRLTNGKSGFSTTTIANHLHHRRHLQGELLSSNSRPLQPIPSSKSFLPSQPFSRRRRLPTLARIRREWDGKLDDQLEQLESNIFDASSPSLLKATWMLSSKAAALFTWNKVSSTWSWISRGSPSYSSSYQNNTAPLYTWTSSRVYYDPLQCTWNRWQTD